MTGACPAGSRVAACGGWADKPSYSGTIMPDGGGTSCTVGDNGGAKVVSATCAPIYWAGLMTLTKYPEGPAKGDWVSFAPPKGVVISGGCRVMSAPFKMQIDTLNTSSKPWRWTCGGFGGDKQAWAITIPEDTFNKYNCQAVTSNVGDWGKLTCPNSKVAFGCGCQAVGSPYMFQENRPVDLNTCSCGGHGGSKRITAVCCSDPASISVESMDTKAKLSSSHELIRTELADTSDTFIPRWTQQQIRAGRDLEVDRKQFFTWVLKSVFNPRNASSNTILADLLSFDEAEPTCDYKDPQGTDYRGDLQVAYDGTPCIPWPTEWAIKYYGAGLRLDATECAGLPTNSKCFQGCLAQAATNKYCRNPIEKKRPFCMTAVPPIDQNGRFDAIEPYFKECNLTRCADSSCSHQYANGTDYDGKISFSMKLADCLPWSTSPIYAARAKLESWDNFCRNPDGEKLLPWCLVNTTVNNEGWAYCDVGSSCLEIDDYLDRYSKAQNV